MSLRVFLIRLTKIRLSECRCGNIRANVPPIPGRHGGSLKKSVPNRCGLRYIGTRRFVRTIAALVRVNPNLIGTYSPLSQRRPCLDRHCVPARLSLERPWKPPRNIPVAIHHCGATCAAVQQLHAVTPRCVARHGCRSWLVEFSIRRTQVKRATESAALSRKLDGRKVA